MRIALLLLLAAFTTSDASLLRGVFKKDEKQAERRLKRGGGGNGKGPCGVDTAIFDNLGVDPLEMNVLCKNSNAVRDDPCVPFSTITYNPTLSVACTDTKACPTGQNCYQIQSVGLVCSADVAADYDIQPYAATLICPPAGTLP